MWLTPRSELQLSAISIPNCNVGILQPIRQPWDDLSGYLASRRQSPLRLSLGLLRANLCKQLSGPTIKLLIGKPRLTEIGH